MFFFIFQEFCGCLVSCGWLNILTHNRIVPQHWTKCKLSIFLWHFLASYSSALLAIMSVEKCYALYYPLKSKTVCTVKTAKWVCSISAVLYFAYHFPLIIFFSTVYSQGTNDLLGKTRLLGRSSLYYGYASLVSTVHHNVFHEFCYYL